MVSTERYAELEAAFKNGAAWGASIIFLDSINSVDELEELVSVLKDARHKDSEPVDDGLVSFYRENLTRWPDPKLDDGFKRQYPLVSGRLDTPQKVRVFLRGAAFRGVPAAIMGSVFETILTKHEVQGKNLVCFERYRGDSWCDALRIVYHTQLHAWTLTRLMLPGHTSSGISSGYRGIEGLFIEWRSDKEREAAGER